MRTAFSQEGEDLLLLRIFEHDTRGVYVDVGAHHPFRFSNTCLLHERGWHGINIDALPGSMSLFERHRPGDRNLELGVSAQPRVLEYFSFVEPALNTFDRTLARERILQGWPLLERRNVGCRPLAEILAQELPKLGEQTIDLLTVDVEGLDLEVLQSNDWQRFQPRVLVVEVLGEDLSALASSPVGRFCESVGYRPLAKLVHSAVFARTP